MLGILDLFFGYWGRRMECRFGFDVNLSCSLPSCTGLDFLPCIILNQNRNHLENSTSVQNIKNEPTIKAIVLPIAFRFTLNWARKRQKTKFLFFPVNSCCNLNSSIISLSHQLLILKNNFLSSQDCLGSFLLGRTYIFTLAPAF